MVWTFQHSKHSKHCLPISIIELAGQQVSLGFLSLPYSLCDRLECLNLPVRIDDVSLRHIIVSPKLKDLSLPLSLDQSRLHQVHLPSDITPLYNMRVLSFKLWDLQLITSLLRNEGQMFQSISLCICSRPTIPVFSAFFTALLSRRRICSLRSVTLQSRYWESDLSRTATSTPLYDILRPLTCLSYLGELPVHLDDYLPINDDELTSLVQHLAPSLEPDAVSLSSST